VGRGRKKEFDREAALEAALGVFWERGFDGASMPALVGRMGIGRQSLYDTFGDKRALYLAVLRRYATTRIGAVAGQLRAPGSAYGNLRRVLFRWIEMAANPVGHGCLVGNSLAALPEGDDDAGDILEAALSDLERAFVETVRRSPTTSSRRS
jgi:TetR/AcrR family transcriptional repressor of nem operon